MTVKGTSFLQNCLLGWYIQNSGIFNEHNVQKISSFKLMSLGIIKIICIQYSK